MNEVNEGRAVSPCGGRSESPSQRSVATAQSGQSSAAEPPSEAREHLTARGPWQSAAETVTETDQSGGGPCGGREDEPERPRRRNLVLQLPAELHQQLERLAAVSGLPRAHFLTTSIVIGAKRLSDEVRVTSV